MAGDGQIIGRYVPEADWPDFAALLRSWKRGELTRPSTAKATRAFEPAGPETVVLLEQLDTGSRARAEVVAYGTARQVMDVCIVGYPVSLAPPEIDPNNPTAPVPPQPINPDDPDNAGTLTLLIEEEGKDTIETDPISLLAFAGEFEEILNRVPEIRARNPTVSLGNRDDATIMRWRIAMDFPFEGDEGWPLFTGRVELAGVADVIISHCPFVGTGRDVEVVCNIPVGDPTPLRAGAQCGVLWFPSMGAYGFSGAEPRKFEPPEDEEDPIYEDPPLPPDDEDPPPDEE